MQENDNSRISDRLMKRQLNNSGFYIIRKALSGPEKYLEMIRKDNRVHSSTMWEIRFAIKEYFARIWETNDLVCSFDGSSIDSTFSLNWHVDQNMSHTDGMVCIQGVLALTDSNATELLLRSHKYFNEFGPRCTTNNSNEFESYLIPKSDNIWEKNLPIYMPVLKPGDILLFDSRLIHRVIAKSVRSVVYISMVPRSFVSEKILKKRKRYYSEGVQTTHWCSRFITTNKDDISPDIDLENNELV